MTRALELANIHRHEQNPRGEVSRALIASEARVARLEEALLQIEQWASAYPVEQFPEPDLKRANAILAEQGISMTAMHGTWGRHITQGVGDIARDALREPGGSE